MSNSSANARATSQTEQAIIRIVIAGIVSAYMGLRLITDSFEQHFFVFAVVGTYFAFSICLLAVLRAFPAGKLPTRYMSLVSDLSMSTFAAYEGGELLAPFFPVYLWIVLGHGIRYGTRFLLIGGLLGAVGFGLVIRTNDYWLANTAPATGMLLTLIVIPLFVSVLVRKLERSKREAEAASEAKSRFLANMSHEIRTPLTGIMGLADVMQSDELSRGQREQLESIRASASNLLLVLEDILDISKIEAEKAQLRLSHFDVRDLIDGIVRDITPRADEKGLKIFVDISSGSEHSYLGDVARIRQVLTNLSVNAVKFTHLGHVLLSVRNVARPPHSALLRFEIHDTGIGIAEAEQARIFDEFAQIDESPRREQEGVGLGTTISRRLVEMMNGQIGVESSPGQGSTFWFELPLEIHNRGERSLLEEPQIFVVSADATLLSRVLPQLSNWGYRAEVGTLKDIPMAHGGALLIIDLEGASDIRSTIARAQATARPIVAIAGTRRAKYAAELPKSGIRVLSRLFDTPQLFNAIHASIAGTRRYSGVSNLADYISTNRPARRILIAEDKPTNRDVIKLILEKAGHTVQTTEDGEGALDALSTSRFDLAIIDFQMPKVSGLDVLQTYRFGADPIGTMPFLILTAHATTEVREECESHGADAFLTKPVDPGSLLTVVDQLTRAPSGTPALIQTSLGDQQQSTLEPLVNASLVQYLRQLQPAPTDLKRLFQGFKEDTIHDLATMQEAASARDLARFHEAAHGLKGSAGSIGAQRIETLAEEARAISDAAELGAGLVLVKEIRAALAATEIAFYTSAGGIHHNNATNV